MHTLRYIIGDSIFFPTIKHLATDSNTTYTHTTNTSDVEKLFSRASGIDLSPLFHLYLYTTDKLEVDVKQQDATHYLVKLLNIDMPLPLDITTDAGMTRKTIDKKGMVVVSNSMPLVDTRVFYLKKVIYE
jgi:aminopeptidase N